jgi:transposase InsO family protein
VRRPPAERTPLNIATKVNEMWSMDFVSDSLANGRRLKCLTVADDFSHEAVDIAVDYGISAQDFIALLDQAAWFWSYSAAVRTDNGLEFTSRAFIGRAQSHGIRHILIEPGRPVQNGDIESFNGRFRDECLNEHFVPDAAPGARRDRGMAARLQRGAASRKHRPRATGAVRRAASPAYRRCCSTAHTNQQRDPVTFKQDFCNIGAAEGGRKRMRTAHARAWSQEMSKSGSRRTFELDDIALRIIDVDRRPLALSSISRLQSTD